MELARPQIREKPSVAAKPRLKAPLLPPKPRASASLSVLSPPSKESPAQCFKTNHNNELNQFKCLPKTPVTAASKPKPVIQASSCEALPPTLEKPSIRSPEPPPLPSVPPPIQRKGPLSPSSSLSLPASFRSRNANKSKLQASPTVNSFTSLSISSSFLPTSARSLARNVSPPSRPPPAKAPKPRHITTQHKCNTRSETLHDAAHLSDDKMVHSLVKDSPQSILGKYYLAEINIDSHRDFSSSTSPQSILGKYYLAETSIDSHRDFSSSISPSVSAKSSIISHTATSQKPEPVPSPETFPCVDPELSPLAINPDTAAEPSRSCPVQTFKKDSVQDFKKDSKITDVKSSVEKESSGPPPLPQNPPRAGFSRKPRHSNVNKLKPTAETKQPLQGTHQIPHSALASHSKEGTSTEKVLEDDVFQAHTVRVDCTSDRLHMHALKHHNTIEISGSSTVINTFINSQSSESIKSSIPDSNVSVLKIRTPPIPALRTNVTLQPPLKVVNISSRLTDVNDSSFVKKVANQNLTTQSQSTRSGVKLGNMEPELDYVEAYPGNTDGDKYLGIIDGACIAGPVEKVSQSSDHLQNNVSLSDQNVKETDNLVKRQVSVCSSNSETPRHSHIDNVDEFSSLFEDKPEETCDMLREIQELLKNKLGDLELDTINTSTENSEANPHHRKSSEQRSASERTTLLIENPSDHSLNSSSSFTLLRSIHQANMPTNIGSLESLDTSNDNSSTECLASADPSKISGSMTSTGKKMVPKKPKRTFLHRASHIPSDVTGLNIGDNTDSLTSEQHPKNEKPYQPYLESLKQSESGDHCPPLPPRNKPRSVSLKENTDTAPPIPKRGIPVDSEFSMKRAPETAVLQPANPETTVGSRLRKSARSRPSRDALPPPPPGPPKRSATFSPGDSKQLTVGQSGHISKSGAQDVATQSLIKSYSFLHKRSNDEEEDHEYHEISDNGKNTRNVSSPDKEITNIRGAQTLRMTNSPEEELTKTTNACSNSCAAQASYTFETSSPTVLLKTKASHTDQKRMEKMTSNNLIQKVAQGLGLRRSSKKSKNQGITALVGQSNKIAEKFIVDDFEKSKFSTSPSSASENGTASSDNCPASSPVMQNLEEHAQKESSSGSSVSFSDPQSEVSQLSTSTEQQGSGQEFESQNMEEIMSSGTDTEPEQDKEEIYVLRKAKKVFFIAKEIVSSETTFVDVLRLLNLDFRIHISRSTEKLGHHVVSLETLNRILDYLPQLLSLNEDLLKDLKDRIEKWDTNPRLADVFVKKGPFLKLYSSYIRNFENASAILEDACKKNPAFAAMVKDFEMSPRCARLALKHYMLKPIQRIPQYKLLLQDYLKHLTEGSPDYKDTITALNIVSEVADHANDSMRHGDNLQKLMEVQRSLVGQFEVIQPGRVLLKQGELQKLSRKEMQPRMFFLFNDVLLYTTPTSTGYKINNILPLTGMKINVPKMEDYKYEFNIISVQRSFTLCASSHEEKELWMSALETSIEDSTKKHHTFQSVRQGLQTSLQDKDFVLGRKAPLWVPDARVTMCMLCLLEFTLTLRRHHCRSCGRVVCSHCSMNKAPLLYLNNEAARVCDSCFDKLFAELASEIERSQSRKTKLKISVSDEDSNSSVAEDAAGDAAAVEKDREDGSVTVTRHEVGLSLHSLHGIMDKFQKIRGSKREKRRPNTFRPSVLKEVRANDEGSDMSGYLHVYRSRRWKRLWFVVKGKVLYTYKASQDMAATESMPLLGYEVTKLSTWFEGCKPDLLFELSHQNNQPLNKVCPRVANVMEKATQRLIFRTDSAAAMEKWLTVLIEASLT